MSVDTGDDAPPPLAEVAVEGLLALVGALLVNVVVVGGVRTLGLVRPFQPVAVVPVALFTAAGVVGATVVYAAISRLTADYDWTFTVVAGVALLLSFVPDVLILRSDPEATLPAVLVLAVLHVTTAVISVAVLTDLQEHYV